MGLQRLEGIIKDVEDIKDIRIGTDIVDIKSSSLLLNLGLYVKMQLQQKLPLLIFFIVSPLFELLFK